MTTETKILGGVLVATVVIIVGGAFFMSARTDSPAPSGPIAEVERLVHDGDPAFSKGAAGKASDFADAKVTVVEFGDFQCPSCGAVFPIFEQLKTAYADKPVRFVWRQFPLPNHEFAQRAAEASLVAHAQGKFWDYYKELFENQQNLKPEDLEKYAAVVGLDIAAFKTALDEQTYKSAVQTDVTDGNIVGVRGTPTFFINGTLYTGRYSVNEFQAVIDAELAK